MKLHTLSILLALAPPPLIAGEHWPNWRGPDRTGVIDSPAETYPAEWSSDKNIAWRTPVEVPGNSSPIVWGDRLFLTQGENQNQQRSLLCFNTTNGKLLWKKSVERSTKDPTHKTNPGVSASPLTDGKFVIAWHGNAGLHAYDFDGKLLWSADLGDDYKHIWGANAGSPVLFRNHIIVHAGPGTAARLVAVDKTNGNIVWKKDLPQAASKKFDQFKGSWATPRIIENSSRAEMIIPLPGQLTSFDPNTGDELWHCSGLTDLCYTDALIGDDILVAMCGYGGSAIGMKRPSVTDTGDLTDSHRLWHSTKPKPPQRIGTGQIIGGHIYMVNAPGIAQCIELTTGKEVWKQRLGRETWSSLRLINGLLYSTDKSSTTHVLEPSSEGLRVKAKNEMSPPQNNANSTPAFANGTIYLRTPTELIAIRER
jgi:outer membrane protein assembly factor BamB